MIGSDLRLSMYGPHGLCEMGRPRVLQGAGRRRDREVQLLAFDLLELDGEDLRPGPLERHKAGPAKLLRRSPRWASSSPSTLRRRGVWCLRMRARIVLKRRDAPYRHGRCRSWLKVKNPESPAALRVSDEAQRATEDVRANTSV